MVTKDEAALRVWVQVYGCYDHFPEAGSFSAFAEQPEGWVVEGKNTASTWGRSKPRRQLTAALTPMVTLSSSFQATAFSGPPCTAGRPAMVAMASRVAGT